MSFLTSDLTILYPFCWPVRGQAQAQFHTAWKEQRDKDINGGLNQSLNASRAQGM